MTTDARAATVPEIADLTGWSEEAVRDLIRSGQLPGCLFVPSAKDPAKGRYYVAFAPFLAWWRDGITPAAAPADETRAFVRRMRTFDTITDLVAAERAVS